MLEPPTSEQVLAKLINYDIYAKEEYLLIFFMTMLCATLRYKSSSFLNDNQ